MIHNSETLIARVRAAHRRARGFTARRMAASYLETYRALLPSTPTDHVEVMTCAS